MKTFYARLQIIGASASSGTFTIEAESIGEALAQVQALHIGWVCGQQTAGAQINVLNIGTARVRGVTHPLSIKGFLEVTQGGDRAFS